METVCEISIPIVLSSKSIQMESKHSNLIMLIVAMLISGVAMLIAAVIIKHNRSLEEKFNRMQKQLDRARKGYGKDKAVSDLWDTLISMLIKKNIIIFRTNVLLNRVVIRITYFTYFWPNFILTLSDTTLKSVFTSFWSVKRSLHELPNKVRQ